MKKKENSCLKNSEDNGVKIMRAELIMLGTELLLGEVVDTNATFLARNLADLGVDVFYKSTVGDNFARAVGVLTTALSRSDVVIMSGGLGPTDDDLTREIISEVLGKRLEEDEDVLAWLTRWFMQGYGRSEMPVHNRKQALFPADSVIIPNPVGTAPGFWLEHAGKIVIALPGVAQEMREMFTITVAPFLAKHTPKQILVTRNFYFVGVGESRLEEILVDLLAEQSNPTLALYASGGVVRLRMAVKAESRAIGLRLMEPYEMEVKSRTNQFLFGIDEDGLEKVTARILLEKELTLTVAESCTGGLISHWLTNVPGSSGFLDRSYIVYSNRAKVEDLSVKQTTLDKFGAVSEETAREMAEGARSKTASDFALAVTGIAGPGGATATKPVGLVYISLASDGDTIVQRYRWHGTREQIKNRAALMALQMLWQAIR